MSGLKKINESALNNSKLSSASTDSAKVSTKFSRWNPVPIAIGQRFGRLTVVKIVAKDGKRFVHSKCDCGGSSVAFPTDLRSGRVIGCGCVRIERISATPESIEHNFWKKVIKTVGCWEWTGTKIKNGYGRFSAKCKHVLAHRYSFVLHGGTLEIGKELDHLCRNTSCVNPAHLEQVTRQEHARRSIVANKTHCIHGHSLSGKNLYFRKNGGRTCATCNIESGRRWRAKKRISNYPLAKDVP